jgi:hypothetical protein
MIAIEQVPRCENAGAIILLRMTAEQQINAPVKCRLRNLTNKLRGFWSGGYLPSRCPACLKLYVESALLRSKMLPFAWRPLSVWYSLHIAVRDVMNSSAVRNAASIEVDNLKQSI